MLVACLLTTSCAQAPGDAAGVTVQANGGGHVTLLPSGVDCAEPCTVAADGRLLTAVPVPDRGFRFEGWDGACSGARPCRLPAEPGARLTASFVPIQGPTHVVDRAHPQADDANPGTPDAPWRTLQHAADAVAPGDAVEVRAGRYDAFCLVTRGTPAAPIAFRAAGRVVVQGTSRCDDAFDVPDAINVEGADHVIVEGFRVRDGRRAGIRVVEADGVVVRGNRVGPNGRWGIFTGFAPHVQIVDNVVFGARDEHGIYVSNSRRELDVPLVRGNEVFDNATTGIQLNGDCHAGGDGRIDGALVEGNRLYHNASKALSLIGVTGGLIRNELIHDNGLEAGAGGIHLANEPGCPARYATRRTALVNVTVVEPRMPALRITDGATGNLAFNALLVASPAVVDEAGGNHLDDASNHLHGSADALFLGIDDRDFRLRAGSAAVDAGRDAYRGVRAPQRDIVGTARPTGRAVDVGAYERAVPR